MAIIEPMATTTTVKLISKDGCEFCIPLSCCRLSEVITSSELECQEESSQEDGVENQNNSCITLSLTTSRIHSTTLRKVVDFLTHYEKEEMIPFEPPFDNEDIQEIVKPKWYSNFITKDVDHSLLIDIISAANFLVSATLFESLYIKHIKIGIIMTNFLQYDMMCAYNQYLKSIQPLLKLAALAMSISINGKSPDELRPMFGMSNNLDEPQQKARVMKENEWVSKARR